MRNIIKITLFTAFMMLFFSASIFAEEYVDILIYNRNEKVQSVNLLLHENGKYFICVEDLSKINLKYNITEKNNGDYTINIYSSDAYGVENELTISATAQKYSSVEFDKITGEIVVVNELRYAYNSSATLKSKLICNFDGIQTSTVSYGWEALAKLINNKYYVSFDIISEVFSYFNKFEDNTIYLWITDEEHAVINGEISMRDDDVAPSGGMEINLKVYIEDELDQKYYTTNMYTIPENENSVTYFTEIYIPDVSNFYIYAIAEYANDYKIIRNWCKINKAGKIIFDADVNEKMLGVLIDLPIDITADLPGNEVFLKNKGSTNIEDATLYCAIFKEAKLVDVQTKKIEWIGAYEGTQRVGFKTDWNDLDYSEIKLFLWSSKFKPYSKVKVY